MPLFGYPVVLLWLSFLFRHLTLWCCCSSVDVSCFYLPRCFCWILSYNTAASKDQLIKHALLALRETISPEGEKLNSQNATIAVVGKDIPFTILENEAIEPYVSSICSTSPFTQDPLPLSFFFPFCPKNTHTHTHTHTPHPYTQRNKPRTSQHCIASYMPMKSEHTLSYHITSHHCINAPTRTHSHSQHDHTLNLTSTRSPLFLFLPVWIFVFVSYEDGINDRLFPLSFAFMLMATCSCRI